MLISGGSGLLAVNWAYQMRDQWDVHLLLHHRKITIPGVSCHTVDITKSGAALEIVNHLSPDLVINTAALTNVEKCEKDRDLATLCNVVIPSNMVSAARATGSCFVHISTDHLFDGKKPLRCERDQPSPKNHYGMTKWRAEGVVFETLPESLVIRTNFFGWGPPYRRSFSDWILSAMKNGQQINLFTDVYFTPVYVSELIKVVHGLYEAGLTGIFNIVSSDRLSKYQFGKRLCRVFNYDESLILPALLSEVPNLAPRPLDMSLCNHKLLSTHAASMPDLSTMLEALAADRDNSDLLATIENT